jgi:uncharacterized phage protein gp47/JayE
MFEDKTFENILNTMLEYVSSRNSELDTREGSIIYTALAPIAIELETAYHEMDMIIEETFLSTASMEYLVKHGNQIGVPLIEATYPHFKGEFNVDVPIGSRFNLDKFNYNVIAKLAEPTEDYPYYTYNLICETAGSEPNSYLGDLTPITYVQGIAHAKLVSVLVYGEDEEETESYRYRLQTHVNKPPINGNVSQYDEWLSKYTGIGKYRTIPCWNGINTVKLMVLDAKNKAASDELLQEVQNYFDPPNAPVIDDIDDSTYPQGRGMGNGQAPIGAIVTVKTVTEIPVKIECKVTLKQGYTAPVGVQEAVEEYLSSIVLNKSTIGYMPISAEIYNAESVEDVVSLRITVNGVVMDTEVTPFIDSVSIGNEEIAVLDTVNSVWSV